MREREPRFAIACELIDVDAAALRQYGRPIWRTWPPALRLRTASPPQLFSWVLPAALFWFHIYADLRMRLQERRMASVPLSSTFLEGDHV